MVSWIFKKKEPPLPPPIRRWIGNISAAFTKKNPDFEWRFWYQLYEDQYGKRTYELTGRWPAGDVPETHIRYSVVVAPFLEGCNLNIVWYSIDAYDTDYWNERGYYIRNTPAMELPVKNKLDFKLLKFPAPNETKDDGPKEVV